MLELSAPFHRFPTRIGGSSVIISRIVVNMMMGVEARLRTEDIPSSRRGLNDFLNMMIRQFANSTLKWVRL
jgi:hypothetical protein